MSTTAAGSGDRSSPDRPTSGQRVVNGLLRIGFGSVEQPERIGALVIVGRLDHCGARIKSGSLAMLTAIRRASSLLNNLAAERRWLQCKRSISQFYCHKLI